MESKYPKPEVRLEARNGVPCVVVVAPLGKVPVASKAGNPTYYAHSVAFGIPGQPGKELRVRFGAQVMSITAPESTVLKDLKLA